MTPDFATPSPRNGGTAVAAALVAHGVDTIFGIPGTHNLEIYRALTDLGVRIVTTRHEQGAAYAADGYSQVAGAPGVVVTTSGPGAINAMVGVATAYAESRPVLVIAPGQPGECEEADLGRLHETKDVVGAMSRLTAWSLRVSATDEIPQAVADAFETLRSPRPRPVFLEIPTDVLEAPWGGEVVQATASPAAAPSGQLVEAVRSLDKAHTSALLLGGGASGAAEAVARFVEHFGSAVVTTCNGKGTLPEHHPQSLGANIASPVLNAWLNDVDSLVVVGSELGESDLGPLQVKAKHVTRIDVDPAQLQKNCHADAAILGDAAEVLIELVTRSSRAAGREPTDVTDVRPAIFDEGRQADPLAATVNLALSDRLPSNVIIAGDSSQITYMGTVPFFKVSTSDQFLYMSRSATLGYAVPAAIGAKVAAPHRPVVALLGDGALMFSVQELVTAAELGLDLVIVVIDNGGYAEIKHQELIRGIEPVGVDLFVPDLVALSNACGVRGIRVSDTQELADKTADALAQGGPALITLAV